MAFSQNKVFSAQVKIILYRGIHLCSLLVKVFYSPTGAFCIIFFQVFGIFRPVTMEVFGIFRPVTMVTVFLIIRSERVYVKGFSLFCRPGQISEKYGLVNSYFFTGNCYSIFTVRETKFARLLKFHLIAQPAQPALDCNSRAPTSFLLELHRQ